MQSARLFPAQESGVFRQQANTPLRMQEARQQYQRSAPQRLRCFQYLRGAMPTAVTYDLPPLRIRNETTHALPSRDQRSRGETRGVLDHSLQQWLSLAQE